eukprot:8914000-Lingulodinium_polyedra.AAC.1
MPQPRCHFPSTPRLQATTRLTPSSSKPQAGHLASIAAWRRCSQHFAWIPCSHTGHAMVFSAASIGWLHAEQQPPCRSPAAG